MQIVLDPPATVGALAAALGVRVEALVPHGMFSMGAILATGPLTGDVADVSAEYDWDIYHHEPVTSMARLADCRLVSYSVRLVQGTQAVEAALRASHGEPQVLPGRRGYGPFYVGGDTLEWYASPPDWALAPIDVAQLAAWIAGAASEEELGGPALVCEPPLPALAFARALGCDAPVAHTVDVHMSRWRMEPLRAGAWQVEAMLAGPPGGDLVAGARLPAASVRQVGESATVRSLAFTRAHG